MLTPTKLEENRHRDLWQRACASGDDPLKLLALACLAEGARAQGLVLEAAGLFGRALAVARQLGDREEQVNLLVERADCWTEAGDLAAAERDQDEAEAVTRAGVYGARPDCGALPSFASIWSAG